MAGELFESGVMSWLDNLGSDGDCSIATDTNDADTAFSLRCGNCTNRILSRVFHGGRSVYLLGYFLRSFPFTLFLFGYVWLVLGFRYRGRWIRRRLRESRFLQNKSVRDKLLRDG